MEETHVGQAAVRPKPKRPPSGNDPTHRSARRRLWLGLAVLIGLTLAAYWPAGSCGFVNLDDDAYVFHPLVSRGLSSAGVVWAFTSVHTANWHPFTTLSHMLDRQLLGLNAEAMHWENVALHLLNSVLVLLIWRTMTAAFWRPLLVASLFALHPLHVESVAWISERKDLLSTLFWLVGIAAYLRWTRTPSTSRYVGIALALTAALLAKPMAVTFPCTLLLLDVWPLKRSPELGWRCLLREKLPLFGIVAAHSIITIVVQHSAGAARYAERFSFADRLGNAFVAYGRYLGKTLWPETLAPLYYHPGAWPWWQIASAVALLAVVSYLAWQRRARSPWFIFGWLWFLGTLVPVIGIVQVGVQSMADRYTYVPLLGIFTLMAWSGEAITRSFSAFRLPLRAAAVVGVMACAVVTHHQVTTWTDSERLYRHSIAVGEDNAAVRYLLATALAAAGRPEAEVVSHYQRAIELKPDYVNAHTQLAGIAVRHQQLEEARRILARNIQFEPTNATLYHNLGVVCQWANRPEEALRHFQEAIRLDPRQVGPQRELAQVHAKANRLAEARTHYEAIVRADPWNPGMLTEFGILLANLGEFGASRSALERALWIDPANATARQNLDALNRLQSPQIK